jgi:hypothetical protein
MTQPDNERGRPGEGGPITIELAGEINPDTTCPVACSPSNCTTAACPLEAVSP